MRFVRGSREITRAIKRSGADVPGCLRYTCAERSGADVPGCLRYTCAALI